MTPKQATYNLLEHLSSNKIQTKIVLTCFLACVNWIHEYNMFLLERGCVKRKAFVLKRVPANLSVCIYVYASLIDCVQARVRTYAVACIRREVVFIVEQKLDDSHTAMIHSRILSEHLLSFCMWNDLRRWTVIFIMVRPVQATERETLSLYRYFGKEETFNISFTFFFFIILLFSFSIVP